MLVRSVLFFLPSSVNPKFLEISALFSSISTLKRESLSLRIKVCGFLFLRGMVIVLESLKSYCSKELHNINHFSLSLKGSCNLVKPEEITSPTGWTEQAASLTRSGKCLIGYLWRPRAITKQGTNMAVRVCSQKSLKPDITLLVTLFPDTAHFK